MTRRYAKDVLFARNFIAETQRQFLKDHGVPPDPRDEGKCIWCCVDPVSKEHAPYCSKYCAVQAECA